MVRYWLDLMLRLDQFIVQQDLVEVGGLDADADRVAQGEDPAGPAAYDPEILLVELEEIRADGAQRNHALDFVGSISAYIPHSVTPETWASNSMPTLSCMNSTSLYLTDARSASVAMISRSDACMH